jgi:hypothetical protein
MIEIPYVHCVKEDRETIWSNLPYCGTYTQPYADYIVDVPYIKQVKLVGRPLPLASRGANKSLRLIGFNRGNDLTDPISAFQPWRLMTYSSLLEYRVKWTTTSKCSIGFYVENYLSDSDSFLSNTKTLLIGKSGPCLFKGKRGCFYFANIVELCVITDKDVTITLDIKCRAPRNLHFHKLKLYQSVPYKLSDGTTFARETRITDFDKDVSFIPVKKYIQLTADIKKYLVDTSIILDFTEELQNSLLTAFTQPLLLKNVPAMKIDATIWNSGVYTPSYMFYANFSQVKNQGYKTINHQVLSNSVVGLVIPTSTSTRELEVSVQYVATIKGKLGRVHLFDKIEHKISGKPAHLLSNSTDLQLLDPTQDTVTLNQTKKFKRGNGHFFLSFWMSLDKSDTIDSVVFDEVNISYES